MSGRYRRPLADRLPPVGKYISIICIPKDHFRSLILEVIEWQETLQAEVPWKLFRIESRPVTLTDTNLQVLQ